MASGFVGVVRVETIPAEDEEDGEDNENAKCLRVGQADDEDELEHVHETVEGALDAANHAPFLLRHVFLDELGDGQVRHP